MANLRIFAVIAFLACLAIVNVTANQSNDDLLRDENGNRCPCASTADLNYVCGTNGKTYPNKSVLECDSKCKKSNIVVKHRGKCSV